MTTLALWVVVLGGFYLLLEVLCSERGATRGSTWFDIAPTLTVSKKKRTRGDVNREGLTRRSRVARRKAGLLGPTRTQGE